jgi:hypothetical protein
MTGTGRHRLPMNRHIWLLGTQDNARPEWKRIHDRHRATSPPELPGPLHWAHRRQDNWRPEIPDGNARGDTVSRITGPFAIGHARQLAPGDFWRLALCWSTLLVLLCYSVSH